jgi:5-methylcytosine-specific restriction protein B
MIEELTRANLAAVLGELMTYLEHRERPFISVYSRKPVFVAKNLTLLATYNPTDRTAIDLDAALIRRLRIVRFSPSIEQLAEMLNGKPSAKVISKLQTLFKECSSKFPAEYEHLMPFGHGIFADVKAEIPDLYSLWEERIQHFLRRPLIEAHPFTEVIEQNYPWRDSAFEVK